MEKTGEQLVVRQHERFTCKLRADVGVAADSDSRVVLSRNVGNGTGVVQATVVDCSSGGLGLESRVYLPRQSRLTLRVELDGAGASVEFEGTVQRVSMISREPRYYLGLAFRGQHAPSAEVVNRLLAAAGSSGAEGGSRA